MRAKEILTAIGLGALGILAAAGIAVAADRITGEDVGLSSEPVSVIPADGAIKPMPAPGPDAEDRADAIADNSGSGGDDSGGDDSSGHGSGSDDSAKDDSKPDNSGSGSSSSGSGSSGSGSDDSSGSGSSGGGSSGSGSDDERDDD